MASLVHRGMINGNSIVWKPAKDMRVGDSAVYSYMIGLDEYASIVKVTSITYPYKTFDVVCLHFDNMTGIEVWQEEVEMIRIPPQNPRHSPER